MLRRLCVILAAAVLLSHPPASYAAEEGKLANAPITLRIGYLKGTTDLGPVGPAEAAHIEHIADWYVTNHIIPTRPDIAPFLIDISK